MEDEDIVYGLTKQNLWAYVQSEKIVKDLKYGTVTVTYRIHNGEVVDLMTQEFKRYRNPDKVDTKE